MVYTQELGLEIADYICVTFYLILILSEIFIIIYYIIPLRIKSVYIILFYTTLCVVLSSSISEGICRLAYEDPGFMVNKHTNITPGDYARHVSSVSYIILGFVISATMFQLSVSLAVVLSIIDVDEANKRKWTYNICVSVISLVYIFCCTIEVKLDMAEHREHMIFEVMGLIVLCLIYFSTIVDLLRKLSIFVLEEAKLEAWFVRIQFFIFFIAYGSKVITLLYWIKNPPHERHDTYGFLINSDVMSLLWILIPISFLLFMDVRSFSKMREEKVLLNLIKENNGTCHSPRGSILLNNSELLTNGETPDKESLDGYFTPG
jgi:hypothetical protein